MASFPILHRSKGQLSSLFLVSLLLFCLDWPGKLLRAKAEEAETQESPQPSTSNTIMHNGPLNFAAIGNTGKGRTRERALVAQAMAREEVRPDFLIVLGDNFPYPNHLSPDSTEWGVDMYHLYNNGSLEGVEMNPVMGETGWLSTDPSAQVNKYYVGKVLRAIAGQQSRQSKWHFPNIWYAHTRVFNDGGKNSAALFVHMDTFVACASEQVLGMVSNEGNFRQLRAQQGSWLQDTLEMGTRSADWIILVGHFPVWAKGIDGQGPVFDTRTEECMTDKILPAIIERYRVDLYLSSHTQRLAMMRKKTNPTDPSTLVVVAGTGAEPGSSWSSGDFKHQIEGFKKAGFVRARLGAEEMVVTLVSEKGYPAGDLMTWRQPKRTDRPCRIPQSMFPPKPCEMISEEEFLKNREELLASGAEHPTDSLENHKETAEGVVRDYERARGERTPDTQRVSFEAGQFLRGWNDWRDFLIFGAKSVIVAFVAWIAIGGLLMGSLLVYQKWAKRKQASGAAGDPESCQTRARGGSTAVGRDVRKWEIGGFKGKSNDRADSHTEGDTETGDPPPESFGKGLMDLGGSLQLASSQTGREVRVVGGSQRASDNPEGAYAATEASGSNKKK